MKKVTITEAQQIAYALGYKTKEEGKTFEEGMIKLLEAIIKSKEKD